MNGEGPFENRLKGLPQRPVPPRWRREILSAAREGACAERAARPFAGWVSRLEAQVAAWLWPNPKAWAGLAAVWVLALGLNYATREPIQPAYAGAVRPSPQARELLREQTRLLVELVGPNGASDRDLPKSSAPQPRGEYRREYHNV